MQTHFGSRDDASRLAIDRTQGQRLSRESPQCRGEVSVQGREIRVRQGVKLVPDRALATHLAAVTVERSHADQGGNPASVELAQIGQLAQQHGHTGGANAWHAGQGCKQSGMVAFNKRDHLSVAATRLGLEELDYPFEARTRGRVRDPHARAVGVATPAPGAAATRRWPAT